MILLNYDKEPVTTTVKKSDYSIKMMQYELSDISETELNQIRYMKENYLGMCKDNTVRLISNNESKGYLFCVGIVDNTDILAYYVVTGDITSGVAEVIESWK